MQTQAIVRGVRLSVDKGRLVADLIRGKKVDQARNILKFTPKKAAGIVLKALDSAIANAENNHGLDVDDLIVSEAWVGKNLVMKRFHARGRGRSSSITKPFAEITVVVREAAAAAPAAEKSAEEAN